MDFTVFLQSHDIPGGPCQKPSLAFPAATSHHKRGPYIPPLQATRKDPKSNNSKLAMPRLAPFFILVLLILLTEVSPGQGGGVKDVIKPAYPLNKMRPRKVLVEVTLDYDYGGPNTRHDPKKGRPGVGGGKNP